LQWLQSQSQTVGDSLNNVRWETGGTFSDKKREYLKENFNELETNIKNLNIGDVYRGIREFKKGYQPRTTLVNDETDDVLEELLPSAIECTWF